MDRLQEKTLASTLTAFETMSPNVPAPATSRNPAHTRLLSEIFSSFKQLSPIGVPLAGLKTGQRYFGWSGQPHHSGNLGQVDFVNSMLFSPKEFFFGSSGASPMLMLSTDLRRGKR